MKKEFYQPLYMQIMEWTKQDVVTLSTPASIGEDDLGSWNSDWFNSENN